MLARLEEEKLHDGGKLNEPRAFPKATIYIGTFCNCFQGFSVYIVFTLQTVKRNNRPQRLCCASEAKNIGEWCDVRHTMCYARNTRQQGVTLVTPCVAVVTGSALMACSFGLGFSEIASLHFFLHLLFFLFHLCFK
jgi:hypothetical protein